MDIGVEISLYPLHADFAPAIREFLGRLGREEQLRIVTNSMSTQVFGAYETVMETLKRTQDDLPESGGRVAEGRVRDEGARAAAGRLSPQRR